MIRTPAIPYVVALLAAAATCIGVSPYCGAQPPASEASCQFQYTLATLPVGSVIATSNLNPADNEEIPGYLNHYLMKLGMDASGQPVGIESQVGRYGNGVQTTPLSVVYERPYRQPWAYVPYDAVIGQRAALYAQLRNGNPYGRAASFGPMRVRDILHSVRGVPPTDNCVSLIRRSYEAATGRAYWGWRVPDDINARGDLFYRVVLVADSQPPLPAQPMGVTQ